MAKVKNGVFLDPIEKLVKTVDQNRALADAKFVARSVWLGGTKTEVTIEEYYAGETKTSAPNRKFTLLIDEAASHGGTDLAPNPMEYLLAAVCGCITAGIATNSAIHDTTVDKIEVVAEGNMNLLGFLGIDKSVSSSLNLLNYSVSISGPDGTSGLVKAEEVVTQISPVLSTIETAVPTIKKVQTSQTES